MIDAGQCRWIDALGDLEGKQKGSRRKDRRKWMSGRCGLRGFIGPNGWDSDLANARSGTSQTDLGLEG